MLIHRFAFDRVKEVSDLRTLKKPGLVLFGWNGNCYLLVMIDRTKIKTESAQMGYPLFFADSTQLFQEFINWIVIVEA